MSRPRPLQIDKPRRPALLQAAGQLGVAQAALELAAEKASAGGLLLPIAGLRRGINRLCAELERAMPRRKA